MPAALRSSGEVGTEAGGYRLLANATGTLRLSVWGYWTPDVARTFASDGLAAAQKLSAAGVLLVDAADLKPQGSDGQEAWRAFFRGLVPLTFARATVLGGNALTRMQLARLLREAGLDGRVEFVDSSQATPGT
jgi:hypothetical protein